jgi:predicted permease
VALAVGATTAVFSVVNGILLEPLPFPDAGRLVRVWGTKGGWMDSPRPQLRTFATHFPFSVPTFNDLQEGNRSFSAVGAYSGQSLTFMTEGRPEILRGQRVTSGLFRALGVEPTLGRYLLPEDDRPGADPVVVLSYGTWRDDFGADPGVVGRGLHLGADTRIVVGIMPAGFSLPGSNDAFWTSLPESEKVGERDSRSFSVVGRLRPGVTLEAARSEMDAIMKGLAEAYPDTQGDLGVRLESYLDSVVGDVRATLLLLLGAVVLVLVIACANIAGMLSVLGLARRRELAIKAALGAGSGRLARSRLVESVLPAGVGGVGGVALAAVALPALVSLLPPDLPRRDDVSMSGMVLAFGLGVTLLTAIVVALVPSLQAGRVEPGSTLRESGRGFAGGGGAKLRSAFVVAEVALAFVLLVGAGLLGNSFERLWHVDRGFDTEGLVEAVVYPDPAHYPEAADRARFAAELRERLSAIPGARVSATSQVPLSGSTSSTTFLVDRSGAPPDSARGVLISAVLDNYFSVMRIPLLEGRPLRDTDDAEAPRVAVVNEAMAREYWPGRSALGQRIRRGRDSETWATVVGIAGNVRHMGLDTPVEPKVYVPAPQARGSEPDSWVIRAPSNLSAVAGLVRDAVAEISPDTPVWRTQVLQERVARSVAVPRFRALLVLGLAGMAAILALLGVYGMTSFVVSRRTREIGVRMALGSEPGAVVRRVLSGALRLTALGLALGLAVAIPASGLVSGFLFQIAPTDPLTFGTTALAVVVVSTMAAWLPARRAASVDPVRVLKDE